jgi:hypothetical protein
MQLVMQSKANIGKYEKIVLSILGSHAYYGDLTEQRNIIMVYVISAGSAHV